MSELLKKQNYGVEVEFTGISRKMAADAVAEIIGTTASRPDHTCYQTRTIQDSQGRKWKVMRDSSINPIRKVGTENMDEYRVEFVTPVLKYEDLDTLQAIIRKFREIGGVPHASCGIHIHVDGANHTATSLRRLVNFMYSRQEIIYDALAVGSRKNRWCLPVCKNLLDTMKKDKNMKYFHLLISFTVAFIAVIMFFNSVSKIEKFSSLIPQNSTPSSPIFSPIKRIFPTIGHPCLSNS